MSVAVRPSRDEDHERLALAVRDLGARDPAMQINPRDSNGETILKGMNELHLELICARILHEFKIPLEVGEAKILYLETVRGVGEAEGRYVRRMGGAGNYGHVNIRVEPNDAGAGFEFGHRFVDEIEDGAVPQEYIEPTEQGIREALRGGVLAGYEVVDVKVQLLGGSYHPVDSNEMAFRIAGAMAFRDAARRASPVLLEPVMALEIVIPEMCLSTVLGDLNARRGRIQGTEQRADSHVIHAHVPLSEMFGYERTLRVATLGRLEYSVQFLRYEEVPRPLGGWGGDGVGVPANKPKPQGAGRASAAARPDAAFE